MSPRLHIHVEEREAELYLTFHLGEDVAGIVFLPKPLGALLVRALRAGARELQQPLDVEVEVETAENCAMEVSCDRIGS